MTALAALTLSMASCSDIDEADRFIDLPAVETKRAVLLEEFTGQLCVNCPAAHQEIAKLLDQYGENLVVVSIHAGFQSIPAADGGLATTDGQVYADAFGVDKYPSAVVDRSTPVLLTDQWAAAIRDALQKPSFYEIDIDSYYDAENDNIKVAATVTPMVSAPSTVQLWLVEDNIETFQLLPHDDIDLAYRHSHVFRAALNGVNGEAYDLKANSPQVVDAVVGLSDDWNVANLHVVAFVYDDKGVCQAAQALVKAN